MKRMLALLVVLGVVAYGTAGANAQNILTNGNFDLATPVLINPDTNAFAPQPRDWTRVSTTAIAGPFADALSSEGFAGGAPTPITNDGAGEPPRPEGCGADDCGVFFKPFQGNETRGDLTAHLFQDNPGTPGMKYILTGWVGAELGYSGLIPDTRTQTILALEFDTDNDFGNGSLQTIELDVVAAGLVGGTGAEGRGYTEFMVMGVAPEGASVVRARMSMIDAFANTGGQALVIDDFSLICVPEPASLALIGLAIAGLVGIRRRSS